MILGTQGGVQIENSDKLEFADLLNENAMFLNPQGLQNEAKMVPKRAKRRKRDREEGKREQRSAKRALESVLGVGLERHPLISGVPGGGSLEFAAGLGDLSDLEFRRGWALKVSKSVVK